MKLSKGKANPGTLNKLLKKKYIVANAIIKKSN